MDEKKVLASVADTLVEKPVTLKVDILHPSSYEKLLFKIRISTLSVTGFSTSVSATEARTFFHP